MPLRHKRMKRVERVQFHPPMNSAPDGSGWSKPRPGPFTSQKELQYQLHMGTGAPHCRSERVLKTLLPPSFELKTAQPVASRYIQYDILTHIFNLLAPEFGILILANPVCKMRIIQLPKKKVAL
jgi:hypothetical protein